MATGDVWQVVLHWKWGTIECRPGFHLVEGSGGGGVNPAEDVAAAVLDVLDLTGFSDQSQVDAIEIRDAQPGLTPTQVFPNSPAIGTVVDVNPLPPQSAAVISLHTAVKPITGAFAAAGRIYLPGIPQNGQISGFLQAGFQATLSAFASALFAPFVDDGTAYQMHIVSYTPNSKPRTIRAINPVTSFTINNVVRSQRSREFGVGI
jgi:hypothetical protein